MKDPLREYLQLTTGCALHYIMSYIDSRPYQGNVDLHGLIKRLRSYYEGELQQLILMPLPDTHLVSQDPVSDASLQEMEKMISLMLGAAVQGEGREEIIGGIRNLSLDFQTKLAEKIQEMTQDPQKMLSLPGSDLSQLCHSELEDLVHVLYAHLKDILKQRDDALERLSIIQCDQQTRPTNPRSKMVSQNVISDPNAWQNHSLRIADLQSKLRRVRQELEEKSEELLDSQQQVQLLEVELRKTHQQVRELSQLAAQSRGFRDELDGLRERSRRSEGQVNVLTEKLRTMDLIQRALQEEKELSRSLFEDKEVLEHQLSAERERSERLRMCEREKQLLEEKLKRVEMERDSEGQRVQSLLHDNLTLAEEIRMLREETSQVWERVYETDGDTVPKWEIRSVTEREQSWEKQDTEAEFLDLSSEMSQAFLRLEKENQYLRERLQVMTGDKIELENTEQYPIEQKEQEDQITDKLRDLCVREEPDGGSLVDKDHLSGDGDKDDRERKKSRGQ